ncbi:MAG: beta-N-acetylhexosaminidase [Lachnospiraceae bacterium]
MAIIPLPKEMVCTGGELCTNGSMQLDLGEFSDLTEVFVEKLTQLLQWNIATHNESTPIMVTKKNAALAKEAYILKISKKQVRIEASTEHGIYYGFLTFLQHAVSEKNIPCVEIHDGPKHEYRGFMLDCSRHFIPMTEILKLIDNASEMKMNRFHWHLTDDQGWRLAIAAMPELTSKEPEGVDIISTRGYYSKQEILDVVKYAKKRMVEIVPEIDIPGHTLGLLHHHPELACIPGQFTIATSPGISEDVLCPGKDTTYQVLYTILDEVAELFPYPVIHIGGDEVPKSRWLDCEDCRKKAKEEDMSTPKELETYFLQTIVDYLNAQGKTVMLWNDALMDHGIHGNVICEFWMTQDTDKLDDLVDYYPVIDANFNYYYLDYPIEIISLKKTYEYVSIFRKNELRGLIGHECPIWTELIDSREVLYDRVYPRLFAAGEGGWTEDDQKSYTDFINRLSKLDAWFKSKGIILPDMQRYDVKGMKKSKVMIKHYARMINLKTIKIAMKMKKQNHLKFGEATWKN